MNKIQCVIVGVIITLSAFCGAIQEPLAKFASLRVLDFPIPYCQSTARLEIGSDYFIEIENDLPGKTEYNSLIRLYQKKNWFDFDSALSVFRKQFESSPLIEAVEFLQLQSEIEQVVDRKDISFQKIESKFRDLLVLYPRSTLSPILHATMANYYLKTGAYSKALGLYRAAREDYPFHSSACTHLFGESEANFFLGNLDESQKTFSSVLQKCQSNRLQIAAKVRLVDIKREKSENIKVVEKEYERLREDNPTLISRFHPELLYNLGEIKYRNENFQSSTFYFNDFSRNVTDTHICQPKLQKRLADLSKHNKKKNAEVIGQYLSVFEKYPKTDLGRFSRVHALLLDFGSVDDSEAKRRLDIIDTEINSIRDTSIKDFASIEKGLGLIERRDEKGLEVLKPLKERLEAVFTGELNKYIRQSVLEKMQSPFPQIASLSDKAKDRKTLEPLERFYKDWFYQTPDAEKAEQIYRDLMVSRFSEAVESGNVKSAVYKLERWKNSDLFQKKWADKKTRYQLGGQLASWWMRQTPGTNQTFAKFLLDRSEGLKSLLNPEGEPLWIQAAVELNDISGLDKALKALPKERSLANKKDREETSSRSAYSLILGRAFRLNKNFKESEFYLNQVVSPELILDGKIEKMKTLTMAGKAKEALQIGFGAVNEKQEIKNKEVLSLLREAVVQGKQWTASDRVLAIAKKTFTEENTILPFLTMEGRALLELGKYKESQESYVRAIKLDPAAKDIAESRFNLARCLIRLKDVEGAKKEWQEVASLKDDFWSPLATNELKILEKP